MPTLQWGKLYSNQDFITNVITWVHAAVGFLGRFLWTWLFPCLRHVKQICASNVSCDNFLTEILFKIWINTTHYANLVSSAILTTCDLETMNQSTVRRGVSGRIFDSKNGIKLIQLYQHLFLLKLFKLTIDQWKTLSSPFISIFPPYQRLAKNVSVATRQSR